MELRRLQEQIAAWGRDYRTKKERTPAFIFAHIHEEVSEAWKCWREGDTKPWVHDVTKHGVVLAKPEGLAAELADGILLLLYAADELGISPKEMENAVEGKLDFLNQRLAAKRNKKGKK